MTMTTAATGATATSITIAVILTAIIIGPMIVNARRATVTTTMGVAMRTAAITTAIATWCSRFSSVADQGERSRWIDAFSSHEDYRRERAEGAGARRTTRETNGSPKNGE